METPELLCPSLASYVRVQLSFQQAPCRVMWLEALVRSLQLEFLVAACSHNPGKNRIGKRSCALQVSRGRGDEDMWVHALFTQLQSFVPYVALALPTL